jgi:hypothetical protein
MPRASARRLATVTPLRQRSYTADPGQVATFAQTLTEGALACRDVGHGWKSGRVKRVGRGYHRIMICRDCGAERPEDLDGSARRVKVYAVQYPDGYLLPKGSGRVDSEGKAAMRLELLRRGG